MICFLFDAARAWMQKDDHPLPPHPVPPKTMSEIGRALRLRGANARIVSSGTIRVGDDVSKV